ncbi:MAG TPA: hypothetical protein VII82_03415 [Polyangiaceae bacterium]
MLLAFGALGACAAGAVSACITAPPPDLPVLPARGPRILEDGVIPPTDAYLTGLPADGQFLVPVEVSNPAPPIVGRVFVDFYPGIDNMRSATMLTKMIDTQPSVDGGPTIVSFSLSPTDLGDPTACHLIQFYVADSFSDNNGHTAGDNLGADSVSWFYTPNGPNGCFEYDAGDGAAEDAPTDALLLTPPDGVGSH